MQIFAQKHGWFFEKHAKFLKNFGKFLRNFAWCFERFCKNSKIFRPGNISSLGTLQILLSCWPVSSSSTTCKTKLILLRFRTFASQCHRGQYRKIYFLSRRHEKKIKTCLLLLIFHSWFFWTFWWFFTLFWNNSSMSWVFSQCSMFWNFTRTRCSWEYSTQELLCNHLYFTGYGMLISPGLTLEDIAITGQLFITLPGWQTFDLFAKFFEIFC